MNTSNDMHPGAAFLVDMFGPSTADPVFVCSLPNTRDAKTVSERFVATREPDLIERFAGKWDQPGRALYFCVSTLKPNARRRAKETLSELNCLFVDVDFKNIIETPEEARRIVGQLMLAPSKANFTGHGLHLFWLFKEGLEATPENIAEVERLIRLLCNHVGGDPNATDASRLLRLPGSHNTKEGEWIEVKTEIDRNARYGLDELAEWLEMVSPVIHRREVEKGNGHDTQSNPWLEVAAKLGFKPPIDVEHRLAAMQFHGPGESAIHPTQVSVSAALLTRGVPVEEVVAMLLEATRAAAGGPGADWNWRREESAIRDMCETWLAKHPAPEILRAPGTDIPAPEPAADGAAENVEEPAVTPSRDQLPIIRIVAGELPRMVREAGRALVAAGFPVFVRAGRLVCPVAETVPAADGRTTVTAKLREIVPDLVLVLFAQAATFIKFDARRNAWVSTDPPRQLANTLLVNEAEWPFPRVIGVATNPVLRADGSLLTAGGYDAATQLYLVPDPAVRTPVVAERPTRADAQAALELLTNLLSGFVFATPTDRAVALSLILTVIARSSMPVAPLHLVRAPTAGTGKSHLVDTASAIATGRYCPVITAGKTPEEAEKRLGALLRESVPIISLDNCSSDLEGELLCQLAERPSVRIRILGVSEAPEFECRAAVVATGNNVGPKGDMVRRTLTCTLVADVERPELRKFEFDPFARVLEDRAAYLEAAITIMRAYRAAGSPIVCEPIGSYGRWSSLVRAPLIWLGEVDPVVSMEAAREEDPELSNIRELFAQWQQHLADSGSLTAFEISEVACEQDQERKPVRPEFRDLLMRVAGDRGGAVSTRSLGKWLRQIQGRIVGGLKLASLPVSSDARARRYHVRAAQVLAKD